MQVVTSHDPAAPVDAPLPDVIEGLATDPAHVSAEGLLSALTCADVDLVELICRDPERRRLLLAPFAPRSWAGPAGSVDVLITDRLDQLIWTLRLVCTTSAWSVAPAPSGTADVAITGRVTDLLALATGTVDGALLHLAGRLTLTGDAALLLELGRQVRRPDGSALIDPAALDPDAVSVAITGVPTAHLDSVMAGPFRDLVLDEVFRRLPEFLIAEKAYDVKLVVGFEIGGRPAGEDVDRFLVRVAKGAATVVRDPSGELPADVTLVLDGAQFLRLMLGHLNPIRGVLGGEVKVRGPVMKALAFNSVMRIPGI